MEKLIEKVNSSNVRLVLSFEKPEVDTAVDKRMLFLKRNLAVPGFRKGKAPRSLILRHLGKETVVKQAVLDTIEESFEQLLKDESYDFITDPELKDITLNDDGGAEVVFEVEVMPNVDLSKLDEFDVVLSRETLEPTPDEFDRALRTLLIGYAALQPKNGESSQGDFLFVEVINGGKNQEQSTESDRVIKDIDYLLIEILKGEFEDAQKKFLGLNPGDQVEINEETHTVANVEQVFTLIMPEINDKWLSEHTSFNSEGELKDFVNDNLKRLITSEITAEADKKLIEFIDKNYDFDLPSNLFMQYIRSKVAVDQIRLARQGVDFLGLLKKNNLFESYMQSKSQSAFSELKAHCVGYQVAKKNKLKPKDENVISLTNVLVESLPKKPDRKAIAQAMTSAYLVALGLEGLKWIIAHSKLSLKNGSELDPSSFGFNFEFLTDNGASQNLQNSLSEKSDEQVELIQEIKEQN